MATRQPLPLLPPLLLLLLLLSAFSLVNGTNADDTRDGATNDSPPPHFRPISLGVNTTGQVQGDEYHKYSLTLSGVPSQSSILNIAMTGVVEYWYDGFYVAVSTNASMTPNAPSFQCKFLYTPDPHYSLIDCSIPIWCINNASLTTPPVFYIIVGATSSALITYYIEIELIELPIYEAPLGTEIFISAKDWSSWGPGAWSLSGPVILLHTEVPDVPPRSTLEARVSLNSNFTVQDFVSFRKNNVSFPYYYYSDGYIHCPGTTPTINSQFGSNVTLVEPIDASAGSWYSAIFLDAYYGLDGYVSISVLTPHERMISLFEVAKINIPGGGGYEFESITLDLGDNPPSQLVAIVQAEQVCNQNFGCSTFFETDMEASFNNSMMYMSVWPQSNITYLAAAYSAGDSLNNPYRLQNYTIYPPVSGSTHLNTTTLMKVSFIPWVNKTIVVQYTESYAGQLSVTSPTQIISVVGVNQAFQATLCATIPPWFAQSGLATLYPVTVNAIGNSQHCILSYYDNCCTLQGEGSPVNFTVAGLMFPYDMEPWSYDFSTGF